MPTSDIHAFFDHPILNSPYDEPLRHWELDSDGQPTQKIKHFRRPADFITPIPTPKKQSPKQLSLVDDAVAASISSERQEYHKSLINEIRAEVKKWRELPASQWNVTPETARLLTHWRTHPFSGIRPFFCQIEAVETAIWLTEVAPQNKKAQEKYLKYLQESSEEANPGLSRLALKLATGAGKTTVMAMLIAWQTLNAVRNPLRKRFTKGFLIVAPGITIRDRLRVLKPNDPDSYYASRELVPADMLQDLQQARIVITNYHAFKLREKIQLSKGTRAALKGWSNTELMTFETEGEMLQRVMPELMNLKSVMVINDEAHHCYREKQNSQEVLDEQLKALKGTEKTEARKEADDNREAARLWISGLEILQKKIGILRVFDLSATPFFLSGSGYVEGTLFPWTMSDFSLMDAIECGIVKLPRVPVADNIPGNEMPMFRELWKHIRKDMPKKGKNSSLDPLKLPVKLQTALDALYKHYEKVFSLWQQEGISVPPCFIIVCNNTSTSKLVYDYVSGFYRENEHGEKFLENGRLPLFRNFDENGEPLARPRTLLIDSQQLEANDALDDSFAEAAKDELARFKREIRQRGGALAAELQRGGELSEATILREVMNTVGKAGQLGESIRCVVSVSMLTEGWDANTVTHVLGVRAFGTQLLCEQVIGRALRRQSYDLNEEGLFNVEYSDILGIPFDFTAKPVIAPPALPRETIQVKAVRPERDALEITFPRVIGYRKELPEEKLTASFNEESKFELTPDIVGATITQNSGIIGQSADLRLDLDNIRENTILMHLTRHLLMEKFRDAGEAPKLHLFGQLRRITQEWFTDYFSCKGGTSPAQLLYKSLADTACSRIEAAITRSCSADKPVRALLDSYNPQGSTRHVNFTTSKKDRWQTDPRKCHINWVITDSDWEAEFCRVAEAHPKVKAYVKNQNLGFEVPYTLGGELHHYLPDFILLVDDGHGEEDLLHLVVEIKGYRGEDAKEKKSTMETYWIPGVNNLTTFGRWEFVELKEIYQMEADFEKKLNESFNSMIENAGRKNHG
ncbi:BPTD_3080 family restriction endonuclease [Mailhella massiliensis]|uniref:BPTD_3080 family restriction endonuclease n=1 Tax=Mailhella massiliensis TaxID=1903261 RepID=UPI003B5BE8A8